MSEYVLQTRGISKKYGKSYAIQNVSVEIKRGQIYGLIGLNGAGKTTFMRSLVGLISPTSGEMTLFGQKGTKALQQGRRRIGQIIETPAVYPNMTAVQNLEIQRILAGASDKNVVKQTLALVGLSDTGKKKAKNFSLGMKQRLALGIALVTNPEFLILDEPANGLDPMGIIEMRELIRRLAKDRGLTILLSSHLLDELSQIATHYGIIDKGRLVKQLSAEELTLESKQHIKVVTNDSAKALTLLKKNFGVKEYREISTHELWIREQINKTGAMNTMLVNQGVVVESISLTEQKLEEYFLNLTGGIKA